MTTTNDAMFEALAGSYPSSGQTLGDLLYAFWSDKGLQYRGTLQTQFFVSEGTTGTTLGDLTNNYFVDVYDFVTFDVGDADEWLELQVFDRYDTVEQELFTLIW
jgi:hypothetical protein